VGRTAVRPYIPRPRCDYGVRKRSFRQTAEADASALQRVWAHRRAPLHPAPTLGV